MQALAEVHETPTNPLPVAPPGFGVVWTLQFAPFQVSTRVRPTPPGLP